MRERYGLDGMPLLIDFVERGTRRPPHRESPRATDVGQAAPGAAIRIEPLRAADYASPGALVAQVEPLTRARALRGPFDYALPEELRDRVNVGSMLVVPSAAGSSSRSSSGSPRTARSPPSGCSRRAARSRRTSRSISSSSPGWIASEYCSTPSRALSLVLPPGAEAGVGAVAQLVAELTAAGREAPATGVRLTAGQREILERLATLGAASASDAGADHGALRRLEARGLVRLHAPRVPRTPAHTPVGARREGRSRSAPTSERAFEEIDAALATRAHACSCCTA